MFITCLNTNQVLLIYRALPVEAWHNEQGKTKTVES
jgi:hypothetical protein